MLWAVEVSSPFALRALVSVMTDTAWALLRARGAADLDTGLSDRGDAGVAIERARARRQVCQIEVVVRAARGAVPVGVQPDIEVCGRAGARRRRRRGERATGKSPDKEAATRAIAMATVMTLVVRLLSRRMLRRRITLLLCALGALRHLHGRRTSCMTNRRGARRTFSLRGLVCHEVVKKKRAVSSRSCKEVARRVGVPIR